MKNIIIYGRDGTNGANGVNGVNGRDGWRTRGRGETATHTIEAEGTGTGQAVGAETDGREGDEGAGHDAHFLLLRRLDHRQQVILELGERRISLTVGLVVLMMSQLNKQDATTRSVIEDIVPVALCE